MSSFFSNHSQLKLKLNVVKQNARFILAFCFSFGMGFGLVKFIKNY